MKEITWKLPSIDRFFQAAIAELATGTIVIIQLPPHAPAGLSSALCDEVTSELRHIDLIKFDPNLLRGDSEAKIVSEIASHITRVGKPLTTASELASTASQRVYAVEGVDETFSSFWRFLERFRLANHERAESDRDTFLVFINGRTKAPKFDVGQKTLRWEGIVREIDIITVLSYRKQYDQSADLQQLIKARILIELSGTDLGLLDYLSNYDLRALTTPRQLLLQYAKINTWLVPQLSSWNDGGQDKFNGSNRMHSSYHALKSEDQELSRRVWKGQIVSLFPYIEERRIMLAKQLSTYISQKSFKDHYTGEEIDIFGLDIGPLCYQVVRSRAPNVVKDELRALLSARHHLAHLKPVPSDLIEKLDSFR